ncbi:TPA: hypothetical protein ACH3X1_003549 [Trebouxia sp. C0004]
MLGLLLKEPHALLELVLELVLDAQASQIETEHKQINKCSSSIQHGVLVSSKA